MDREPWDALETWLRRFSGYVATKLAMLQGSTRIPRCSASAARRCTKRRARSQRAQAAGEVRTDTSLDDVLRLVSSVTASQYESDEQRERVALALHAIRTG